MTSNSASRCLPVFQRSEDEAFWSETDITGFNFNDEGTVDICLVDHDRISAASKDMGDISLKQTIAIDAGIAGIKSLPHTNLGRLETSLQTLKYSLKNMQKDKFTPLLVEETVKRIILGEPYFLECYKSKEDKFALIDKAVELHDGNAIITVVLFARDTLKESLFDLGMSKRTVAANHYVDYLKSDSNYSELTSFLSMLGKTEEAAVMSCQQSLQKSNPDSVIKGLRLNYVNSFQADANLNSEKRILEDYIDLLERQIPIEDFINKQNNESLTAGVDGKRPETILNKSLMTTLFYSCLNYYELPENHLASPASIRKAYRLTDKQFVWTALRARLQMKAWSDIDQLITNKAWLGSVLKKTVIPYDKVVDAIIINSPPPDVLIKYIKLVESGESRLRLAKKLKCHELAIDLMVSAKDKNALECYKSELIKNTKEHNYIISALNSNTSWKN